MTDPTEAGAEPPADRTLSWWPLVGAAVIAALVAVAIFAVGAGDDNRTGSKIEDDGALACPTSYPRGDTDGRDRVPATPSGVDGDKALSPDTNPRYVTVCRYLPEKAGRKQDVDLPLDARVVLTSGQRTAARDLHAADRSSARRSCTQIAVRDDPSYLVGLTFSTGVVWVSVPGDRCVATTNGQFTTNTNLRPDVEAAFSTKVWPS